MQLNVCQIVGNDRLRLKGGIDEIAVHLVAHAFEGLRLAVPTATHVPLLLRCAPFERPDVVLGPFLGGRRTETDELEGLGQPVDVLHQVMLHFQLGRHGQTQLRELAKDVAEGLHHGVQRGRAHGVGRAEPVARDDVHAEVFGHPAAGAFSGQDGVVHRDFGEGKPAIVSHMLRALRVGVVELAVAVGIDGRLVDHVFQVPPDGRAAHRLRAAFVTVILGAEHLAGRPVEQLRIARRKLHVEFVHSGCKRLVVRSPKRHDQVFSPARHLPRRVVAHVAGQQ